jgi:hypothetical protein
MSVYAAFITVAAAANIPGRPQDVAWVKVSPVGARSDPSDGVPLSPAQQPELRAPQADASEVYAITTFTETEGFSIYTMPTGLSRPAALVEIGRLNYPTPGGVPTVTAGPLADSVTEYVRWAPGDLRDHTLFGHNGELFAVCTTSWGHPGDGTGGSGSGYGNFHILKRKGSGSWVFHSRGSCRTRWPPTTPRRPRRSGAPSPGGSATRWPSLSRRPEGRPTSSR